MINGKIKINKIKNSFSLLFLFYVISVICVKFIPDLSFAQFIPHSLIPPFSWIRFIFVSISLLFLPGYLLLNILFKNNIPFTMLATLVISNILSVFLVPIVTLVSLALGSSIIQSSMSILFLLNLGLLIITFYFKNMGKHFKERLKITKRATTNILVLGIILLIPVVSVAVIIKDAYPLYYGDEWWHYSLIRYILRYNYTLPIQGNHAWPQYAWWYYYYLATILSVSGLPQINCYIYLFPLIIIPLVAFYAMVSIFFKNNSSIPIYATLFSIFGGYGWIYAIYLAINGLSLSDAIEIAGAKTYDIWIEYFYYNRCWYPFGYHIGMASFFILIFLFWTYINEEKVNSRAYFILTFLIFSTGFLSHVIEAMIAVLIIGFYATIIERKVQKVRTFLIALLAGLLFVLLIDQFYRGGSFYSSSYYQFINPIFTCFVILLFFLALTFLSPIIKSKYNMIKLKILNKRESFVFKLIPLSGLIYIYILSPFIWYLLINEINIYWAYSPSLGVIPFFFYPIIFGIVGTYGLIYVILQLVKPERIRAIVDIKVISFFILWILIIFVLARSLREFIFERRMIVFLFAPLTVIAGILFFNILNKSKQKSGLKRILALLMLVVTIISGIMSPLMQVEFFSRVANRSGHHLAVPEPELCALEYLDKKLSHNLESIATITAESHFRILTFTGVSELLVNYLTSTLLFKVEKPQTALYILSNSNIRYIYLAKRDFIELESRYQSSFMKFMLQCLPLEFINDEVTIYYIPKIYYSYDPEVNLIIPQQYFDDENVKTKLIKNLIVPIAFSGKKFRIFDNVENECFKCNSLIIIGDISESEKANKYLEWVRLGGVLIVLGINSTGYFARLFYDVKSNRTDYSYIFEKNIDRGILKYAELSFLIHSQNEKTESLLTSILSLTPKLEQNFAQYKSRSNIPYYEYIVGSIIVNGTIKLNVKEIYFEESMSKCDGEVSVNINGEHLQFDNLRAIEIENSDTIEASISSSVIEVAGGNKTDFIFLIPLKMFNLTMASIKPFRIILKQKNNMTIIRDVNIMMLSKMDCRNFKFLIKANELNINGTLISQKATLYTKPYVPLCYLSPIEVSGNLSLNLFISEKDLLIFNSKLINGIIKINYPYSVMFRTFPVQIEPIVTLENRFSWVNILLPWLFVLLIIVITLSCLKQLSIKIRI